MLGLLPRGLVRVAGLVIGSVAVLSPTSHMAAHADGPEEIGYLAVQPAQGDLTSAMDVATSGVCTRGQNFVLKLDGPKLKGADRGNLVGVTKLTTIVPESYPSHYVLPVATDLATYFSTAAPGQRIKGDYTLTFACRNTLDTADLQVFTATITVDGKGRYVAQGEAAVPFDELIDGYVPGSTGLVYSDPLPPDPDEAAAYAATQARVAEAESQEAPWRAALLVIGVLLLVGAAYAWWRARGQQAGRTQEIDDESVGVGS